ncbi:MULTISPECIES: hypothetical protein [Bradyrhizobium]|nr:MULTISPECIES: hypothetical protein [Bradyrhizobium]
MARKHRSDVELAINQKGPALSAENSLSGHSPMQETGVIQILLGAFLVVGGVLYITLQTIWGGRPGGRRPHRAGLPSDPLEPDRLAGGFGIKSNWPGLAMIAIGATLLLVAASNQI